MSEIVKIEKQGSQNPQDIAVQVIYESNILLLNMDEATALLSELQRALGVESEAITELRRLYDKHGYVQTKQVIDKLTT